MERTNEGGLSWKKEKKLEEVGRTLNSRKIKNSFLGTRAVERSNMIKRQAIEFEKVDVSHSRRVPAVWYLKLAQSQIKVTGRKHGNNDKQEVKREII